MTQCECGFKFSSAGESRDCQTFITDAGNSGVVCPKCGQAYVIYDFELHKIDLPVGWDKGADQARS